METPGGDIGKCSKRSIKYLHADLKNQKIMKNKIKKDFGKRVLDQVNKFKLP